MRSAGKSRDKSTHAPLGRDEVEPAHDDFTSIGFELERRLLEDEKLNVDGQLGLQALVLEGGRADRGRLWQARRASASGLSHGPRGEQVGGRTMRSERRDMLGLCHAC